MGILGRWLQQIKKVHVIGLGGYLMTFLDSRLEGVRVLLVYSNRGLPDVGNGWPLKGAEDDCRIFESTVTVVVLVNQLCRIWHMGVATPPHPWCCSLHT